MVSGEGRQLCPCRAPGLMSTLCPGHRTGQSLSLPSTGCFWGRCLSLWIFSRNENHSVPAQFPSSGVILRPCDAIWRCRCMILQRHQPTLGQKKQSCPPLVLHSKLDWKLVDIRSQNTQVPFWSLQDLSDLNWAALSSPAAPAVGTVSFKSVFERLQNMGVTISE